MLRGTDNAPRANNRVVLKVKWRLLCCGISNWPISLGLSPVLVQLELRAGAWIFSTGIFFSGLLKSSADMLLTNMQIILNVICCTSGAIFSTFTLAKLGIVIGFLLQIKVHCSVNSSHR